MYRAIISTLCCVALLTCAQAQTFTLSSSTVGGQATKKHEANTFGCDGENVSPQLSWKNAPEETKSFAITMYDPDAPTGSGFWHWLVVNIPADIMDIAEGAGSTMMTKMPDAALQIATSFGQPGYGGPCPPPGHGIHEYKVTVHALDVAQLDLAENTPPAVVGFNLWMHTIEKASLVFYYERQQ